jgi:putative transposase
MKDILTAISSDSDFSIDTMEIDKNHVHILISSVPQISILQIVMKLKQESTIRIWELFPEFLRKNFWKAKTFWSDGYFVATTGQVSEETVRRYIENQG